MNRRTANQFPPLVPHRALGGRIRCKQRVSYGLNRTINNWGVGLGNIGVATLNNQQVWMTTTKYMRGETEVKADNSVFMAFAVIKESLK